MFITSNSYFPNHILYIIKNFIYVTIFKIILYRNMYRNVRVSIWYKFIPYIIINQHILFQKHPSTMLFYPFSFSIHLGSKEYKIRIYILQFYLMK